MKHSRIKITAIAAVVLAVIAGSASIGAAAAPDPAGAPRDEGFRSAVVEESRPEAPTPTAEPEPVPAAPETPTAAPEPAPSPDSAQVPGSAPAQRSAPAPAPAPETTATTLAAATNTAVIRVKSGGIRAANGTIGPVAGGVFALFNGSSAPTTQRTEPWATCVTAADGYCTFTIPETQSSSWDWSGFFPRQIPAGVNNGITPWVVQLSAPAGYTANPVLNTQSSSGANIANSAYSFRVSSSDTVRDRSTNYPLSSGTFASTRSYGTWQNSLNNPQPAPRCGLNVGLLVDVSGSLYSQEANLRTAATGFVDALAGTPTRMGVWTFGEDSPSKGSGNGALALTSIASSAGATTVRDKVKNLTVPASNGTNWDAGLRAVSAANAAAPLDLLLVLTDGSPSFSGPSGSSVGPGDSTGFGELEQAIFSANQLKAAGTKVMSIGIGSGVSSSLDNLRAISGPTADIDYTTTANYTTLSATLKTLASGQCAGTVNVTKLVESATTEPTPAAGWTFGAGPNATPATGLTAENTGALSFRIDALPANGTRAVTITETQRANHVLRQQGGKNAVCSTDAGATAVAVTNVGSTGFTVDAIAGKAVNCTVINRNQVMPAATVQVLKKWTVNGTTYAHGEQPFGDARATLGERGAHAFGSVVTGFSQGDRIVLGEQNLSGIPVGCVAAAGGPTGLGEKTLGAGANVFTIINNYACTSTLTLLNTVQNGPALPSAWTLTATGPNGSAATVASGRTGTPATTVAVTPGSAYVLAALAPEPTYIQTIIPGTQPVRGATGSWSCSIQTAPDSWTDLPEVGESGSVTVPLGAHVRCLAVQVTAELRLAKLVRAQPGSAAVPADWTLRATPDRESINAGVPALSTPGAAPADAPVLTVRPGSSYTLSEDSGPSGFALDSLVCQAEGAGDADFLDDVLIPRAGAITSCVFSNVQAGISVVKKAWFSPNGAEVASGALIPAGTPITWTYLVSNTGLLPVENIVVTDDRIAAASLTCPVTPAEGGYRLAVGESMTCTATAPVRPLLPTRP
ncbi:DUF7507 domain-containing protein [Mycetocola spongiae]|uniref:DUF7507 domain-containing protein n=1 Tax=Mycetocola spongiae TaxID=2859226 RepID=UPI0021F43E9C|nr:VWA domain-containing protein [Mycetocola spongiae]UCR89627.1 VWA domain-containing protein [Mycetocola spongiae]